MKRISSIVEIAPEESVCITIDSDRKLFRAGGGDELHNIKSLEGTDANKNSLEDVITSTTLEAKDMYDNVYSAHNEVLTGKGLNTGGVFVSHNSVLQRNIVFACILRPQSWSFVGVDLKKVELTPYIRYSNVVLGVATTLENAVEVLRFAQQTMMKRYEMMTQLELKNFLDLPEKGQALLVMIDEYAEAASPTGAKSEQAKEDDAMKGEIQMIVGSIARLGRAAGVHMAVATQRPDAKLLPGETKYLDVATPILTTEGFKTMGELTIGDKVFDEKGKTTSVVNMTDYMYDNTVYKMSFHGASEPIVSGAPHRWPVRTQDNEIVLMTTEEMSCGLKDKKVKSYDIDLSVALETQEKDLPIDPVVLGQWLCWGEKAYTDDEDVSFYLETSGLKENKHIPTDYLLSSVTQRKELLFGVLGENYDKETNTLSTPLLEGKILARDISTLVQSLGYKAGVEVVYSSVSKYQPLYRVDIDFNASTANNWVHSVYNIEKADTVPTKCIEVDNHSHTYLAGYDLIPTHNSNLGCRINCGYTNPTASSMILDNAHGTKVKSNPKGRFYLQIYNKGNHGQGFFAGEDWMDNYLDSQGLNPDGSPKGSSAPNVNKAADDLTLKDPTANAASRPEDDWDDELDDLIAENES